MGCGNFVVKELEKNPDLFFEKKPCVIVTECSLLTFSVALIFCIQLYIYIGYLYILAYMVA